MKSHRSVKLTVLAIILLLAAAAAVPWRTLAASAKVAPVPGGPKFLMVDATQFRAWRPETTAYLGEGGLMNPGSEGNFYQAGLSLPDNIKITKVVVYFYDNSELDDQDDLVVALWRCDPSTGDHVEMATVASSGAQDQYRNAADTSIIEPMVNQQSYSYYLEVGMPPRGDTLRVAAVRIDYRYRAAQQSSEDNP